MEGCLRRLFWVILAIILPAGAAMGGPTTQAVTYQLLITANPPLRVHVIDVNLTNPSVHVKVARGGTDPKLALPWEATLSTVSNMATRDHLVAAINGNLFACKDAVNILGKQMPYYSGNFARCCGWAMGDGVVYSSSPLNPEFPALVVDDQGKIVIGKFNSPPALADRHRRKGDAIARWSGRAGGRYCAAKCGGDRPGRKNPYPSGRRWTSRGFFRGRYHGPNG
jgi:hypothetical protein